MFKPLAHAIAPCDVYLGVSSMPCDALMTHDAHLPPFASVGYRSCRYSMQIDQAPCPSLLGFVARQLGNNASCWDQIDGTPHFLSTLTVTVRFDVAWPKLSCGPGMWTVIRRDGENGGMALFDLVRAIAALAGVGFVCFWVGFRLGRTVEFYYLRLKQNRHELDEDA